VRRRLALVAALAVAAAACGVPSSPEQQADQIASIAAEGAILAGDAADGDTTSVFAGEHAAALRKKADELRGAISGARLRQLAAEVVAQLERLEDSPGSGTVAAEVERRLQAASKRADEIAKAAS
jgi:hypothetical protein